MRLFSGWVSCRPYAIAALAPFWGDLPVIVVKGTTYRRYARQRGKAPATVRRELGCMPVPASPTPLFAGSLRGGGGLAILCVHSLPGYA
jgi:hypothetical protein